MMKILPLLQIQTPQAKKILIKIKYTDSNAKRAILVELNIPKEEAARAVERMKTPRELPDWCSNWTKDTKGMQDSFRAVLALQDKTEVENVFTDVNRTTRKFPALSKAVYENIKLLGNQKW